jgi:hypothetical protein
VSFLRASRVPELAKPAINTESDLTVGVDQPRRAGSLPTIRDIRAVRPALYLVLNVTLRAARSLAPDATPGEPEHSRLVDCPGDTFSSLDTSNTTWRIIEDCCRSIENREKN